MQNSTDKQTGPSTPGTRTGAGKAGLEQSAREAGKTIREAAEDVGEHAKAAATQVLDDAKERAEQSADAAKESIADRLDRLAAGLKDAAGSLEKSEPWLAKGSETVAERIVAVSRHLHDEDPRGLLDEVTVVARRHPAMFLAGAIGAGFAVARLAHGAASGANDSRGARDDNP